MSYQLIDKPDSSIVFQRPSKLNVLVIDASGSMYWAMKALAEDTTGRVNGLPLNDAVLIGLFSSEGWFRWVAARELTSAEDYVHVAKIIKDEFYTRGMTCFSEIVADTPQAIKPFLAKYQVVTFTFMSDGHPVVRDSKKEEEVLISACEDLKNYITAGAVVAYGDYANRPLLSKVAKTLGVEFVSTGTVAGVGETIQRVQGGKASRKRKVKVPDTSKLAFAVEPDHSVTVINTGESLVSESATVWSLDNLKDGGNVEDLAYLSTLALLSEDNVDTAVEMLSLVGDKRFVRLLGSAITNSELTKVEEEIKVALAKPEYRFVEGKEIGCAPAEDATDIIDVFELLQSDETAKFYPRHKDFNYKRIGKASKVKEGYPKFIADDNVAVPFGDIVGHSSELNLSVRAFITGTITLPDEIQKADDAKLYLKDTGLDSDFSTNVFRNYSIISNGLLQTTSLPISCCEYTFEKLKNLGLVDKDLVWDEKQIFTLDLTAVPACNKARGKNAVNWEDLATQSIASLKVGSILKVFKAKKMELDPNKEFSRPTDYTEVQSDFLRACGVRDDGSYSPPTENEPTTDVLPIRLFDIKVAKSSSVTMDNFAEMVAGKKKFNWVGELMKVGYDELQAYLPKTKGEALQYLDKRIKELTRVKRFIDNDIIFRKYAIALGGHWFKHNKTDERVEKIGDIEVTLLFKSATKAI